MNKLSSIYSSAYSATISIILTVVITLGAELSPSFKTWLAGFTGHHWVTKSWISILVFIVFFLFFKLTSKRVDASKTKRSICTLEASIVLGAIIILGFYIYEFLKH
ncbi:MAG: hypothetical protein AAB351_00910 [Patescibacteria group bacterium]